MIVKQRTLKQAMDLIEPARQARSTIPILSTIRAHRGADGLKLKANDLDMEFSAFMPFDGDTPVHGIDDPEDFLINDPKSVMSALAAAGGVDVQIDVGPGKKELDHRVAFQAGALKLSQNNSMTVEDFPASTARVNAEGFRATFTADILAQIARVFPAISTEETRYYLNGVHMKKLDGSDWTYRFAATDGHRLFFIDVPLPDAAGPMLDAQATVGDVILPRHFIQAVVKNMARSKDAIRFRLGDPSASNQPDKTLAPDTRRNASRCSISGKVGAIHVEFDGKLIDGTYPAYDRVIPTIIPKTMTANLGKLRQAVKAVKVASAVKRTPVLKFVWSAGKVTISQALGDVDGTATFDVECSHNCDGMTAGFNGNYFLETLNAFQGEEVTISTEAPPTNTLAGSGVSGQVAAPALFRDPCDTSFQAVLMPMRV